MNKNKDLLRKIVNYLINQSGKTQGELSLGAGYEKETLTQAMSKNTGHEAVIEQLRLVYKGVLENSIYANDSEVYDHSPITYSDRSIRQPKTNTNHQTDGITFLPISAQAGYPKRYNDPIFTTQLQKLFIPGFPYRGERYRIWEVEGNSMEPTFKEHFHLLTELVEPDSWKNVRDFYAYVIVTLDDVLFKRIAKHTKNKDLFILISDNEELYPQFTIEIKAIKEIWIVKRKMDWEMSPPKRFDIKI